jgi:peptidoglycan/LPS O-acetylase OafA/YrhL
MVLSALLAVIEAELAFRLTGSTELSFHDSPYTIPSCVYSVAGIFCFLAYDEAPLPFQGALHHLGMRSYGIYLLHPVLLEFTARATQRFTPWVLAYQALFLPVLISVGIAVPALLMAAVAASPARKYYRYLFG